MPALNYGEGGVTRRRFLRLGFLGAIAWTASACGILPTLEPDYATPDILSALEPSPVVTPAQAIKILRNENREGFYIRYYKPFPALDISGWRLEVAGLVQNPASLSLSDLLSLPQVSMNARMKCVECWSVRADWRGFTYQTLANLVQPDPHAGYLRFDCADDYWEILPISEMLKPRALLVTHLNGELLPDEYGAPLRLMLPWKYAYKSAKAITRITFTSEGGAGYWSSVGPYSVDGEIEAGLDSPLDLDGGRRMEGGEITQY